MIKLNFLKIVVMLLMRLAVLNKTGKVATHILIMVDVDIFVQMFRVCLDFSKALKRFYLNLDGYYCHCRDGFTTGFFK